MELVERRDCEVLLLLRTALLSLLCRRAPSELIPFPINIVEQGAATA